MSPFKSVSHSSLLGGGNVPMQVANRQKKVLTTVYEKDEQDHKGVLSIATVFLIICELSVADNLNFGYRFENCR